MNTVQCLGWFFPEGGGGTEVYVASLASQLRQLGVNSTIAAPLDGNEESLGVHEGGAVYRYPVIPDRSPEQHAGRTPHIGFDQFRRWLTKQDALVYHQHSWTYGCGLHHLQAARERGMRTVLTVHVPGPICVRGTMLRDGRATCDGVITPTGCASCWLQSRGMSGTGRVVLSHIPPSLGSLFRPMGRAGTALAATAQVRNHQAMLLAAAKCADHVVAVCQWLYEALMANGVPPGKLSLNRQGVAHPLGASATSLANAPAQRQPGSLVVGFLGRWDPVKGIGLLVDAMRGLPERCPVELHVHAIEPGDPGMAAYMHDVRRRAASHPCIRIGPALLSGQVPAFLRSIDVLAVPSQCLETGPLVVLEAFAAGVPVLGSDLGGIRELVQDGHNGRLLRHDAVAEWSRTLRELAESPETLRQWRRGIGPVRTMRDVADETRRLYVQLLEGVH